QQPLFDAGGAAGAQTFIAVLTQAGGVNNNPSQNTPGLYLHGWGAGGTYLPRPYLADGRPHQLRLALSGTSLSVYVDGQAPAGMVYSGSSWSGMLAQPFALPAALNTAANPLWIGHDRFQVQGADARYFTGTIDEVAVYGTALSQARVQSHYLEGMGAPQRVASIQDARGSTAVRFNYADAQAVTTVTNPLAQTSYYTFQP